MRKTLAIFGLLLFIAGTLILPAMHKLELSRAGCGTAEGMCHPCSSEAQTGDQSAPDDSDDSDQNQHHHDPSTCPICKLAKMPVTTAAAVIALPQVETVTIAIPVSPRQPSFKSPRLLPFSCGPPA